MGACLVALAVSKEAVGAEGAMGRSGDRGGFRACGLSAGCAGCCGVCCRGWGVAGPAPMVLSLGGMARG